MSAICQDSGKFYLSMRLLQHTAHANFLTFLFHQVLAGTVVTLLRCGEILDDYFIANFPESVSEKF